MLKDTPVGSVKYFFFKISILRVAFGPSKVQHGPRDWSKMTKNDQKFTKTGQKFAKKRFLTHNQISFPCSDKMLVFFRFFWIFFTIRTINLKNKLVFWRFYNFESIEFWWKIQNFVRLTKFVLQIWNSKKLNVKN